MYLIIYLIGSILYLYYLIKTELPEDKALIDNIVSGNYIAQSDKEQELVNNLNNLGGITEYTLYIHSLSLAFFYLIKSILWLPFCLITIFTNIIDLLKLK